MGYKFDLSERLIDFASVVIDISEMLPETFAGRHLSQQLLRSGTSPALQYGEAQAAESRPDFVHKMKVCLKELRETSNCMRLIQKRAWVQNNLISAAVSECKELNSIFAASIKTAINGKSVKSNT